MLAEDRPFLFARLTGLVQNLRRNRHLPNVVEQRSPTKSIEIGVGEPKFLTDYIGIGSDSLRVTSCQTVVLRKLGDELDGLLGCGLHIRTEIGLPTLYQLFHAARTQGELEPRGGMIGKDEAHFEQCDERGPAMEQSRDRSCYRYRDNNGLGQEHPSTGNPGDVSAEKEPL